jgi:UDP-N-acetylmuramyl pentapeptide phosphotransferase/UDP-N-acetylglucosamine-1-phosphate transferase
MSAVWLAVLATSALATALGARLAPRLGWTDAPRARDAWRKRQRRAVPAVGGFALLVGLAWSPDALTGTASPLLWARWLPDDSWRFATLALVFAVGTLDDRVALAPGPKSLAMFAALAPLALGSARAHGVAAALALVLVAFTVLNLLNTFDVSDGALAGLCALGFAPAASAVSAACLGFLPFNLDAARARNRESGAPSAYLGDAGAFVLAMLVLFEPRVAGLCLVPALDLARLSLVRLRAGSRPWIGDRRHLAHRLLARGWPRPSVALALCVVAAPACLLGARALAEDAPARALSGVLATLGLYALALAIAPRAGVPCPAPERSE